ncbi:MAG: hypothetical protein K9G33_16085, partial [Sneathiella sp.]|nr:hypothetical protein [Sneathiella sp.]
MKSKAKSLKRTKSITMVEALNEIAQAEGFQSWSHLQARTKTLLPKTKEEILGYLNPGDLVLIGARPGRGKTILTLQILLQASKEGRDCFFFSLEYTKKELRLKLAALDDAFEQNDTTLKLDFSERISSDYVINQVKDMAIKGSIIAIDYLQILDHQRHKPVLQTQIEDFKKFARDRKCILIFISQIDRNYNLKSRERPS